jgi:hypothetical protein
MNFKQSLSDKSVKIRGLPASFPFLLSTFNLQYYLCVEIKFLFL